MFSHFYKQASILRISIIFFLFYTTAYTQEKTDNEVNIASLPYYSFGKGVGITSPDSLYNLNIRFRMQNRLTYLSNSFHESSLDGQIRRLRLRLDGYVGNPKFTYALQLSFAAGDVGVLHDGNNINIIRDAIVFYSPNKNWRFGFGQTKLPGNRQRVNSSGALQLTDRSVNNARFNIDRDFGLQVYYLFPKAEVFAFNVKTAISNGEGRNFTNNDDLGLAYTGKVELYPQGNFKNGGEYFEGDLVREKQLKTMFSLAYQFNDNAKRTQGTLGSLMLSHRADLQSVLADFILKKNGYSFMAAFMSRTTPNPLAEYFETRKYVLTGYGFDLQSSYITAGDLEIIGRYSDQKLTASLVSILPDTKQYSFGVTKYLREHAFKLQGELTYEQLSNQTSSWYSRFQVEMGI
jgi:hypothetical protein